jgi:uncharacterized membrane protein (UPF0127 family)
MENYRLKKRSRRKKKSITRFLVYAAIALGIIFYIDSNIYSIYGNQVKKVILKGKVFRVEIVDTEKKRELGLGGRGAICQECGMLFVFPENGRHPFWMKGMRFSLDIVWLEKGRVAAVEKDIPASSEKIFSPSVDSDQVLEFNAGTAAALHVVAGDTVEEK